MVMMVGQPDLVVVTAAVPECSWDNSGGLR